MDTTWREELAWAAGFFDGEGWSGLLRAPKGKNYARMAIHQVHLPSLERFQRAMLGLGRIGGPYDHNAGKSKLIYKWQASSWSDVQAIGAMLWTFLCDEKRAQWEKVMQQCIQPTARQPGKCSNGHEHAKYRNKHGQCRECLRVYAADRRAAARVA